MQRRTVLATLGAVGTGGCLRLQQGDGGTEAEDTTTERGQSNTDTGTDSGTDTTGGSTDEPGDGTATAEEITLSETWTEELLWEVFVHDGQIAGERSSRGGGYVTFVDREGETRYTSDELGGEYVLSLNGGEAMAADGTAVFAAGSNTNSSGDSGRLAAFDADSGSRLWTHDIDLASQEMRIPHVRTDGDRVYCGASRDLGSTDQEAIVRALSAGEDAVEWEKTYDDGFFRGLAVYDSQVLVGLSQELRVLDASTGTESARTGIGGSASQGFALTDDRLYVVDSEIRAYDPKTGDQLWSIEREREPDTRITVSGGVLYAGTDAGYVTAHDLDDRSKLWETRVEQSVVTRPATSDTAVFVVDSLGILSAVDRTTGEIVYGKQRFEEGTERTAIAALDGFVCVSGLTTDNAFARGFEISTS